MAQQRKCGQIRPLLRCAQAAQTVVWPPFARNARRYTCSMVVISKRQHRHHVDVAVSTEGTRATDRTSSKVTHVTARHESTSIITAAMHARVAEPAIEHGGEPEAVARGGASKAVMHARGRRREQCARADVPS